MKKTISINIAKTIFYIEDDAFAVLDEYLKSIKNHFASDPNRDEIISDMESRMAEQFLVGKEKSKDKIVTLEEVNKLIATMGRVEDFDGGETKAETASEAKQERRLFRDMDKAMVGGVSAGFGAFFNIDPILFRLLFVIITLSGGAGILVYIILWFVMPEAKTPEQKSQMRGHGMNLSGIEQTVKDRVNEAKNSNFLRRLFSGIALVVRGLIKIVLGFAGFIITISVAFALLAATYAFAVALFDKNSGAIQIPLNQIAIGWQYFVFLILGYAAVALPAWLALLIGISMMRGKNIINYPTVIGLVANWFVVLLVSGVLLTHFGPEFKARYEALPQIQEVSKAYMDLGAFTKLDANDAVKVNLVQGTAPSVSAHGRQLDMDHLVVENNNGTLRVSQNHHSFLCILCWTEDVTVDITVPQIDSVTADGAARVKSEEIKAKDFYLGLDGASRAEMNLNLSGTLSSSLDGASRTILSGVIPTITLTVDGASNFNSNEALSKTATVEADGASRVRVNAADSLQVKADGAARVYYQGTPKIKQETDGAARVIHVDSEGNTIQTNKIEFPDIDDMPEMETF